MVTVWRTDRTETVNLIETGEIVHIGPPVCSGGCGKEVGHHPGAVVTCIDCAMEASREAREIMQENMKGRVV